MSRINTPISDFEKPFYKAVEALPSVTLEDGTVHPAIYYHIPNRKLGQGMYARVQQFQREYSREQVLAQNIRDYMTAHPDEKDKPLSPETLAKIEPTSGEISAYLVAHSRDEMMEAEFVAALVRPIGDAPPVQAIWEFFPMEIIAELTDFFLQSMRALKPATKEQMLNSVEDSEARAALEKQLAS